MTRRDLAAGYTLAAAFIFREEGFRSRAYRDSVGIPTIGIGRTRNADGSPVHMGQTTTLAAEQKWFRTALRTYAAPILAADVDLTPRMFAALLSLSYNVGPAALQDTGTWEIARDLKAHRFGQVGEDFDRYANPSILQGRRDREQAMYFRGLARLKKRRDRERVRARRKRKDQHR